MVGYRVQASGFWRVRARASEQLRPRNPKGAESQVKDQAGNPIPIEIAAAAVWTGENTSSACFEVDDFGDIDELSQALEKELRECSPQAGARVIEARPGRLA